MHLRRIRVSAGCAIVNDGILLPATLPELVDDLHELVGDRIALVVRNLFAAAQIAALSSAEVTMFQPIRPSVRWSKVVILRANKYGSSYSEATVMPKPRCRVAAAMAETARRG